MYSIGRLIDIRSSWIYPNGEIQIVSPENHDYELPNFCKDTASAENACVKISCAWGYDAPISEIYLPLNLTIYQAQELVKINESVKVHYNCNIEYKINRWHNFVKWSEVLEKI